LPKITFTESDKKETVSGKKGGRREKKDTILVCRVCVVDLFKMSSERNNAGLAFAWISSVVVVGTLAGSLL
jgi:hypothetical protein